MNNEKPAKEVSPKTMRILREQFAKISENLTRLKMAKPTTFCQNPHPNILIVIHPLK